MNTMKKGLLFAFLIMLSFVLVTGLQAKLVSYRLSLTIFTDKSEEYLLSAGLDDRECRSITEDPSRGIQPFVEQAMREYAEKIGFRKEIYGDDNYKMVIVDHFSFVIRDISQDRVVFQKGTGTN
ncbi:MAG: hypothetical protein HQM08_01910 [Candidatus Riflebacteria bacterium]|nr:hypothetical protein [Candidatus Riflebacteria bacterium]